MRSFLVVVLDKFPEYSLKMASPQDENVVQTLPTCGSHESFGESVRHGCAYRGAHHAHALRVKHLIEGSRILGIAIPDQELGRCQAIFDRQVAGLLGNPG